MLTVKLSRSVALGDWPMVLDVIEPPELVAERLVKYAKLVGHESFTGRFP